MFCVSGAIMPPTCSPRVVGLDVTGLTMCWPNCHALPMRSRLLITSGGWFLCNQDLVVQFCLHFLALFCSLLSILHVIDHAIHLFTGSESSIY